MVKRREPKASTLNLVPSQPTNEQIEAFAAGAEGGSTIEQAKDNEPNQNAIRDYKAIRVPFNQYEYEQLESASKLSGRSKLNVIRYAMLQFAKELREIEK